LIFAIAGVLAATFLVSRVFGAGLMEKPGVFALGAVLMLGLIHLVANGIDERPAIAVIGRTVVLAGLVAVLYFALQFVVERLLDGVLPSAQTLHGTLSVAIVAVVVLSFALVTFLQGLVPAQAAAPRWEVLYAHVSNGLYVNTLANRFILRVWPNPPRGSAQLSDPV
jgi:NAD(P)H-quinone oxidoreductase subunit 5